LGDTDDYFWETPTERDGNPDKSSDDIKLDFI